MQKSLYNQSALTWSPQGRLYQVEYAMEAVNQGNLLLGLRSETHVVLCGFKSLPHETLSYYPEKLFRISNHLGIGIAGLTPDGRLLYQYMKSECLNFNYTFNTNHPTEKLVTKIAESISYSFNITILIESQLKTQRGENKRPYGVGLLIAGYDVSVPIIYNYINYRLLDQGYLEHALLLIIMNMNVLQLDLEVKELLPTLRIIRTHLQK